MAATEAAQGSDPDWTRGVRMCMDEHRTFYVTSAVGLRGTPEQNESLLLQCAKADGTGTIIYQEEEPGSAGKSLCSHYRRNVIPRKFSFRSNRETGSKELRAIPMSAAAEDRRIKLVAGQWIDEFLSELCAFPSGKHDDIVDAASGAFRMLQQIGSRRPMKMRDRGPEERWRVPEHLLENQRAATRGARRSRIEGTPKAGPLDGLMPEG